MTIVHCNYEMNDTPVWCLFTNILLSFITLIYFRIKFYVLKKKSCIYLGQIYVNKLIYEFIFLKCFVKQIKFYAYNKRGLFRLRNAGL